MKFLAISNDVNIMSKVCVYVWEKLGNFLFHHLVTLTTTYVRLASLIANLNRLYLKLTWT